MAILAVLAQLAVVFVHVTTDAVRRKTQVGARQVFHGDGAALRRSDALQRVALLAVQRGVLPLESPPRLAVVKLLEAGHPPNQVEIGAVMLGMARDAVLAASPLC